MARQYEWLPLEDANAPTRVCSKCGVEQAIDEFYRGARYRGGRQRICRTCQRPYDAKHQKSPQRQAYMQQYKASGRLAASTRRRKLRYNFGLSLAAYDAMLAVQSGCCAICGQPERAKRRHSLGVDHDHTTGVIRGLLCDMCNRGIGFFQDNPDLLDHASAYLRRSRSASAGTGSATPLAINE